MNLATAVRPVIWVSRCLGFAACRWNGLQIDDAFVALLKEYVDFVPVCPEVEVGLGCPRSPIRLVKGDGEGESVRLLQPSTGKDITAKMQGFADEFLRTHPLPDGVLLKGRSPSCGPLNVKIYHKIDEGNVVRNGAGLFAQTILDAHSTLPVEEEGRLHGFAIREHWLARIYAGARFRMEVEANPSIAKLVAFHSAYKYLLMACNQTMMREMGRTVAHSKGVPIAVLTADYRSQLQACLAKPFRQAGLINALEHVYGYFKKGLNESERRFYFDTIEEFRRGGLPLSVPIGLLHSWALRFEECYIEKQALLRPYPQALDSVTDSGKGRTL
jgi:uncharacterized protein YbgA (DUF1722 family)/uncharacterized protein YbbK (DUF523 family)